MILVCVRNDIDFEYIHPEPINRYGIDGLKEVVTLRDAISDLEDNPRVYFAGWYYIIFMSHNRKNFGHNQVLRFRLWEDKHQYSQQ